MEKVERALFNKLKADKSKNKVLILLGPRRVGKTFLIKQFCEEQGNYLLLNGEDIATTEKLQRISVANYRQLLGSRKLLAIDEAQKIPEIGSILKLLVDEFDDIKIIVTGSSQFDLTNKLGEPLTGRKKTFMLYPLAQAEIKPYETPVQTHEYLAERLIYGSYPEIFQLETNAEKNEYLQEMLNSYLLKDILAYENIRNASKIFNLLRLIAFQMGKEVSLEELGQQLSMSKNTVEKYLDLLSKVFVLRSLGGYSRNLRKEQVKKQRWYFIDNGIRNAIIANFSPLAMRNDVGELWENYLISERIKFQSYSNMIVNNFFWRTYDQQEIDWVEEREGNIFGFEMKFKPRKVKAPAAWHKTYPDAGFEVISKDNYLNWIGAE